MSSESTVRPSIDFALNWARSKQSSLTKYIHWNDLGNPRDTIPVFENLCFALTLFRTKKKEHIFEAKELIGKILSFQTDSGSLPIFLHQYPVCYDAFINVKLLFCLIPIAREFARVLDSAFLDLLSMSINRIFAFLEIRKDRFGKIEKFIFDVLYNYWKKNASNALWDGCLSDVSSQRMGYFLLALHYDGDKKRRELLISLIKSFYHKPYSVYIGPSSNEYHCKGKPNPSLLDVFFW